jgi:hypothetical protein
LILDEQFTNPFLQTLQPGLPFFLQAVHQQIRQKICQIRSGPTPYWRD